MWIKVVFIPYFVYSRYHFSCLEPSYGWQEISEYYNTENYNTVAYLLSIQSTSFLNPPPLFYFCCVIIFVMASSFISRNLKKNNQINNEYLWKEADK